MKSQISLKWMLIVLGVVGAGVGLLGRLYFRQPEVFFWTVRGTAFVGYFGALAGIVYRQKRGTEQGKAHSIPLLIGLIVISLTWLGFILSGMLSFDVIRSLPTKYLVQKKLFRVSNSGAPVPSQRAWQELDRRLMDNRISKAEADLVYRATEEAIQALAKSKTQGWRIVHAHLTSNALRAMSDRDLVSDERRVSLAQAYYGDPRIPPLRVRKTETPIHLSIEYGGMRDVMGHPTKLIRWLTSVRVDGVPVQDPLNGGIAITQPLSVGKHEVRAEYDCALVRHDAIPPTVAGSYPTSHWPEKLLKRWKKEVIIPVTVFEDDAQIISLTSNKELDPSSSVSFRIRNRVANPGPNQGHAWDLRVEINQDVPVAMSGDLFVTIDGERFPAGPFDTERGSLRWVQSWAMASTNMKSKTATVEYVPNPKYLERETDVTEIWGKKIFFEQVPIELK